jgi:N-acetylmuramoyl-L-alanine amidase
MEMMRRAAASANPTVPEEDLPEDPLPAPEPDPQQPLDPPVNAERESERRRRHAEAMETQRSERVVRRRERRVNRVAGVIGGMLTAFFVVAVAAGLVATVLVVATPREAISINVRSQLGQAQLASQSTPTPTAQPTPNWLTKIGIVAGHRGPEEDPGAVCPDGLTEAEITFSVAQQVVLLLRNQGYSVDLLDEFDPRLEDYEAAALISIHANTCAQFAEIVSGYLVAAAAARVTARGEDDILVDCIAQYYAEATRLERHPGVTEDMSNYHTFREVNALTPAAIIEIGFMLADRDLITNQQDVVARGIANGALCFLQPNAPPTSEPSPIPESTQQVTERT